MSKRTNIGILAHVDAGKTTLTEQMLYRTGTVRSAGSVDDGTATTDWMEIERRRGISVTSACAEMRYADHDICIIDTPGHVDFAGEVERALSVLDGAVLVVTAVDGVEPYTEVLWKAAEKTGLPVIAVINKVDRAGSDVDSVMADLRKLTEGRTVPVNSVFRQGEPECEVCSLTDSAREDMLLDLAGIDGSIEEKLFSEEEITDDEWRSSLADACRQSRAVPVICTCAKKGQGIDDLLRAVTEFLPDSSVNESEALSGKVFRVIHDPSIGKVCFVRLFGGRISVRDTLNGPGGDQNKVTQLRRYTGSRHEDIQSFGAGEVAAVCGLADFRNGDVIGEMPPGKDTNIAETMLLVGVSPESEEDRPALLSALQELTDEEPLLALDYNTSTREISIRITGIIQREVVEELLKERYGLNVLMTEPKIIYKETPASAGIGKWAYVMPKPCWAIVELTVEPLPRGSGLVFRSAIKENVLVRRYQHHVEDSVYETAAQGIMGWEVTDALVTLTDGMSHNVHTHPLDFFVATPVAFLRALTDAGVTLLEPYVKVEMSASEDLLGKVIGSVVDMRGEFEAPVVENGVFRMEAVMPLSASMDFPLRFRSMTSGRGVYSSAFYEYRPCPEGVRETLPRKGVDPLDLQKWILYRRSAIADREP